MDPTSDLVPELDRALALARDLVRSRALGESSPVHARESRSVPGRWSKPVPFVRGVYTPSLGEPAPPNAHELEAQIPETPAQMRELVQVLGPVAVTDMVEAALGPWPGLTRADVEAMVHRRFHGAWWAWDAPAG